MIPPLPSSPAAGGAADRPLRAAAAKLETAFLSEMLKAAGVGKPRATMGGGAGEEQFASFLRDAQAEAMTRKGGVGLSEMLFNALKESRNDHA